MAAGHGKGDIMAKIDWPAPGICTIDNFLDAGECAALIARSEAMGYEFAAVSTNQGPRIIAALRNNDRVIVDDQQCADGLWDRLAPHIPAKFCTIWNSVGLNERLRFYRYTPGQRFNWHRDGHFARSQYERSHFTFMIYLNEGYEGGETLFREIPYADPADVAIRPRTGMALIFRHPLEHKGDAVVRGTKYVLRSDVMYRC